MPMKIGVVTREIACASFIHARSTGPRLAGAINPATARMTAIPMRMAGGIRRPRQYEIAPSTANAAATVKANRRPLLAENSGFVISIERNRVLPGALVEAWLRRLCQHE